MSDSTYTGYGHQSSQPHAGSSNLHKDFAQLSMSNSSSSRSLDGTARTSGSGQHDQATAASPYGTNDAKTRFNSAPMTSSTITAGQGSLPANIPFGASSLPFGGASLPANLQADYNLYAAALAAAASAGSMPPMNLASSLASSTGSSGLQQGQLDTSGLGSSDSGRHYPLPGSSQLFTGGQSSSLHQRTMSAMAGFGQNQYLGASSHSASSSTDLGNNNLGSAGAMPQYGMVGPAGSASAPLPPPSSLNGPAGSPTFQTGPYMASGSLNQGSNVASPAAQAMSAMSSLSGIPSSATSASGLANTPISPATVYTPGFGSPPLSQAGFNAATGLGVGGLPFGTLGLGGMPNFGGLGIASLPMGGPALSQQMSNMSLSSDGQMATPNRTVYVGNLPGDASVDELLSQVRYGPIENVKIVPDKSCAFISFLDASTAAAFHSDANLRKVQLHGQDLKIGWGRSSPIPANVLQAIQQHGATRNVYLGNLDESFSEESLRDDLSRFGHIDQVKIVRDKNIGFVHFLSIAVAIKVVQELPREEDWQDRRVNYGKDRCAYVPRNQHQQQQHNQLAAAMAHQAASHAMSPFNPMSPAIMSPISPMLSPLQFQGGFVDPAALGNRTVYLGSLHPDTTAEDVCNTIRGGILQEVRHIPDKHICFVTFVMAESALALMNTAVTHGISVKNRRLKVGWGKNMGPCPPGIAAIVAAGGSRNVYIGNIDDFDTITVEKIKSDLSEFGEIEQVNLLQEKSCAFANYMKISSAVKAIENLKHHPVYSKFKIAYGKDRVGNMARAPMVRRPYQNRRHDAFASPNIGSPLQYRSSSPSMATQESSNTTNASNERALSPQLGAAVQAAAAVDQTEQRQGIRN